MVGFQHADVDGGPQTGRSSQSEPHTRTPLVVQGFLVCGSWVVGRVLPFSHGLV